MYLLDFVDNFGKRIGSGGRTDLDVFDGEEGENIYNLIKPLGKRYSSDCELEIYMLHSTRAYEIRSAGKLLKTIRFPATMITTTVQCAWNNQDMFRSQRISLLKKLNKKKYWRRNSTKNRKSSFSTSPSSGNRGDPGFFSCIGQKLIPWIGSRDVLITSNQ